MCGTVEYGTPMNEFIESIITNLQSNGFPAKKVSLPTDKMYEAADKRGLSFNRVLEKMKEEHRINAEIGAEKIIFSEEVVTSEAPSFNQEDLIRQAQEMMAQMDPEELRKIQQAFEEMTPDEKDEIFKRGKDLGIL